MASLGDRGGHCCSSPAAVSVSWSVEKKGLSQGGRRGPGSLVDILCVGSRYVIQGSELPLGGSPDWRRAAPAQAQTGRMRGGLAVWVLCFGVLRTPLRQPIDFAHA